MAQIVVSLVHKEQRDLCHQDGKSPMGEPDEQTAAVQLTGAHATECLRNSVDSLQRSTPDNMDPATQLKPITRLRGSLT